MRAEPSQALDDRLAALAWPADMFGQAMEAIAERVVPRQRPPRLSPAPHSLGQSNPLAFSRWLEDAAVRLGMIMEPKERTLLSVAALLEEGGPVLVATPGAPSRTAFLLLGLVSGGAGVEILAPDRTVATVPVVDVDGALAGAVLVPQAIRAFCDEAHLSDRGRRAAERILHVTTNQD